MKTYTKKNAEYRRIWRKICQMAATHLKGVKQEHFYTTLIHANKFTPKPFALRTLIENSGFWEFFSLREASYQQGLLRDIFTEAALPATKP